MKNKLWILVSYLFLVLGCSDGNKSATPETSAKIAEQVRNQKLSFSNHANAGQNPQWDHETRMAWWFTSQGSRMLPYAWFLALERHDNQELVSSSANLKQFKFIVWPADPKWNPDGLPIGFVVDQDSVNKTRYFGFNCAACHTGKITLHDKNYLVEGGPANHDFDRFITEMVLAMEKTHADVDKFTRFAQRILGFDVKPELTAQLKNQLAQEIGKFSGRAKLHKWPHPNHFARFNAFGNIFNEVSVFAIEETLNEENGDRPASSRSQLGNVRQQPENMVQDDSATELENLETL